MITSTLSSLYGRDFYQQNDLLPALKLEEMPFDEWHTLCQNGYV